MAEEERQIFSGSIIKSFNSIIIITTIIIIIFIILIIFIFLAM